MQQVLPAEHDYLRPNKKFPSVWCPGCGNGIVLGAIIRAVSSLRLDKNEVVMVSGIGCSGRMPVYVDFDAIHTTHGRALAFATGIKLARPELTLIVVMGDGDGLAIGGNHFIHAARRNVDLSAIIINNDTYGMTGGQYSPTTPQGARATTAPYGHIEPPFDVVALATAAGAPFVARSTVYHALELQRLIALSIEKKGFSVVEVVSHCHVQYGHLNQMASPVDWMRWHRDHTISVQEAARRDGASGKLVRGLLVDREVPEYTEEYQKLIARAQKSRG